MARPFLMLGSAGPAVKILQTALNKGASQLPKLIVDGLFGSKTRGRVLEFQGQKGLERDGLVGEMTWAELEKLINGLTEVVQKTMQPANEDVARDQIVKVALAQYDSLGWRPGGPVSIHNPRIAGTLCADPVTRARQGGPALAAIFQIAGAPNPQKCLTISVQAEEAYKKSAAGQAHAGDRNTDDIVSWCGIFCLAVYKLAGLKLSSWPLRYSLFGVGPSDELRIVGPREQIRPGDIGVDNRRGLNHHFIVAKVGGSLVDSVDGNSGLLMEIVSLPRQWSITGIRGHVGSGFLRPIWERIVTG